MVKTRFYYLIEELDIDGDKQTDGFLISQYKLDRYKNKIFTKNKYVTFKDFKSYIAKFNENKTGGHSYPNYHYNNHHNNNYNNNHHNNQIVTMTRAELNNLVNNKNHNQYPPHIVVQGNHGHYGHYGNHGHHGNGFLDNLTAGIGFGAGFSIGDGAIDTIFGF